MCAAEHPGSSAASPSPIKFTQGDPQCKAFKHVPWMAKYGKLAGEFQEFLCSHDIKAKLIALSIELLPCHNMTQTAKQQVYEAGAAMIRKIAEVIGPTGPLDPDAHPLCFVNMGCDIHEGDVPDVTYVGFQQVRRAGFRFNTCMFQTVSNY